MSHLPAMPPNTCPDVDRIIDMCDTVWKCAREAGKTLEAGHPALHDVEAITEYLDETDYKDILEALRSSNSALRKNAEHYSDEAEDLKGQLKETEEQLVKAQQLVTELEREAVR